MVREIWGLQHRICPSFLVVLCGRIFFVRYAFDMTCFDFHYALLCETSLLSRPGQKNIIININIFVCDFYQNLNCFRQGLVEFLNTKFDDNLTRWGGGGVRIFQRGRTERHTHTRPSQLSLIATLRTGVKVVQIPEKLTQKCARTLISKVLRIS